MRVLAVQTVKHRRVCTAHGVALDLIAQAEAVHNDKGGGGFIHRKDSFRSALIGCVDDVHELAGVEGRAADQTAVNVLVAEQLGSVGGIHRAAVLNGDGAGDARAVHGADGGAD